MTPEEIKNLISISFTPYKCESALSYFNHRINFRILDKENKIICECDEDITNLSVQEVKDIIEISKTVIRDKGFVI